MVRQHYHRNSSVTSTGWWRLLQPGLIPGVTWIVRNTFNDELLLSDGDHYRVEANVINSDPSKGKSAATVRLYGDSKGPYLVGNRISGGWDGTGNMHTVSGADNAISIYDCTDGEVSDNSVGSVWGCAIEGAGVWDRMQMARNTITTTGLGAICGWYDFGLRRSRVSHNTYYQSVHSMGTGATFSFSWFQRDKPAPAQVYFQDNVFERNVTVWNGIPYKDVLDIQCDAAVNSGRVAGGNNRFAWNTFLSLPPGLFEFARVTPTWAMVDGGGDKCNLTWPLYGAALSCN